uniref:Integrin alpha 4 n=1 Tax=Pygocentrus nattereri TaxID=42514 RepID=A0AAR2KZ81_PYGNA
SAWVSSRFSGFLPQSKRHAVRPIRNIDPVSISLCVFFLRLLVGAPTDDSSFNASIKKPGAVYKCNISNKKCEQLRTGVEHCGKTCWPESDNQWLGVSLSRRPSNGDILACGHRWKNVFFSRKDNQNKLPHGQWLRLSKRVFVHSDHQRKFGENYGSCQAGISNFLTEDLMIMGAPGSWYWTGSVLVHNMSSNMLAAYVDEDNTVQFGSYLGYSVGAGHFLHPQTTEIIGGAPQNGRIGKAYIFEVEGNKLRIVNETSGAQLGSYYGASICAVDLNADGLSDLLVGAPMYSTVREEGRVYVYINQGRANMKEAEFKLVGSESYAARFGETITDLGDIDNDGYPDVAIGAPQEDDLRGAIYIYNGRKSGIASRFSQRITGSMLGGSFSMFGQSVSGGVDVDGNGYPDVAVGAFLSDSAVVLRTRPVVMVEASMMLPVSVNRSVASCAENGLPAVCVNVTVCFKVQGKRIPGQIELKYNLTADVQHKETFPPRFYFHGNGTSNVTAGRVKAKHGELTCSQHQAFMRKDVRDIFTSIHFKVQYELGEHSVVRGGSKSFTSLKPILQQREGHTNLFARYCVWENCSTNLQISARLVLPSYNNVPYFALGNGKTIMLNATLVNAGDDAFLPKLHVRFPSSLHFIRVLDAEEKYVSCEIAEDNKTAIGLDCSVGNLYIPSLSKVAARVSASSPEYSARMFLSHICVLLKMPCLIKALDLLMMFCPVQFCAEADKSCMNLECRFGNLDIGKEVTINLEVELNPAVLQISPRYPEPAHHEPACPSLFYIFSSNFPNKTRVTLEAYYSQKPHPLVGNAIIVFSLLLGLIILAMLVVCLWKVSNSDLLSLILCIRSSSGLGGIFSAEFIHMYFKIIVY